MADVSPTTFLGNLRHLLAGRRVELLAALGSIAAAGAAVYVALTSGETKFLTLLRYAEIYIAATSVILAAVTVGLSILSSWSLIRRVRDVELERAAQWTPQIEAARTLLRETAEEAGETGLVELVDASKRSANTFSSLSMICLVGVELENIRCFRRFALALGDDQGPYLTTVLLGDNAAGKTTILRSIALGLCPESDATSLITGVSGSFLREGESYGHIKLHVRSLDGTFTGLIHTSIEQSSSGGELVRQVTEPEKFPWDRIFVCGYGTHRSSGRPASHERYTAREAVGTLFSDTADLLNPEVVLLRRDEATRHRLETIIAKILLLDRAGSILTTSRGVQLSGPWGSIPIAAMSDGYRSTTQWILDYLGWQIFADRLNSPHIDGVLIIDELEQHLHPRWQRYIIQRIRSQFDRTQLIASTHTPLVAAGVADVLRSQVVRLIPTKDGAVEPVRIPIDELTGKRADQVLADAFGLVTSKSPGSIAKIDRFTELLSRDLNADEQDELKRLRGELEDGWSSGEGELNRQTDRAVTKVLDTMIEEGRDRQIVDAQVRERMAKLFGQGAPTP